MSSDGVESALQKICQGNLNFTFSIYKILSEVKGNLFFSPASMQVILALVHLGAKGKTAQEIAEGLHLPCDKVAVMNGFNELMNQLKGSGGTVLEIANKMYVQTSFPIKEEFRTSAAKFLAETEELDFVNKSDSSRAIINEWVEHKTMKKITDLIPSGALDRETRLVLVNAIYFKGNWSLQFKKEATSPMPFHISATENKTVDMMHLKKKFMYTDVEQLDTQVLGLSYEGDQLQMVIFLPRKTDGLSGLEKNLEDINLLDILNKMQSVEVDMYLPKFKLEYKIDLNDTLKKLGMKTMFDEYNADLTGINDSKPGLFVSQALHKAFIEVNEEGTEAAAATAMQIKKKKYRKSSIIIFKADHPFLFLLRNVINNAILFVGRFKDVC